MLMNLSYIEYISKTHFHDKIDIQDHYPNKELSKLNDMYQIYQDLWEEYEMNKPEK